MQWRTHNKIWQTHKIMWFEMFRMFNGCFSTIDWWTQNPTVDHKDWIRVETTHILYVGVSTRDPHDKVQCNSVGLSTFSTSHKKKQQRATMFLKVVQYTLDYQTGSLCLMQNSCIASVPCSLCIYAFKNPWSFKQNQFGKIRCIAVSLHRRNFYKVH